MDKKIYVIHFNFNYSIVLNQEQYINFIKGTNNQKHCILKDINKQKQIVNKDTIRNIQEVKICNV